MIDTFAALLTEQLRSDPGRPLVTFYDDETGERVELSVATYANWVAKTSSLFVEELDLERGGRLLVDLPTHWLTPVFVGAAWTVGLSVIGEAATDEDGADAIVCGPDGLRRHADRAADLPVVACALRPLGVRFAEPLPGGVHDFGVEVWSQPDAYIPWDPPTGDDEAMPGVSQRELLGRPARHLEPGGRLLTNLSPTYEPATLIEALVAGGSTIWVRNPNVEGLQKKYDDERATARLVRLTG
jgi:uncharacterized protein (TIGR03089 family)